MTSSRALIVAGWNFEALRPLQVQELGVQKVYVVCVDEEALDTAAHAAHGGVDYVVDMEEVSTFLTKWEVVQLPVLLTYQVNEREEIIEVQEQRVLKGMERRASDGGMNCMKEGMQAFDAFQLTLAASMFSQASYKDTSLTAPLFNLASIYMMNYPTLAVHYFEEVLLRDKQDMTSWKSLWNLAQSEDQHVVNCCVQAYRRLAEALDDPTAKQKLASLTGIGEGARKMDTEYARAIYEDFGEAFESRLVEVLGYRGPWILHDMLVSALGSSGAASGYLTDLGTLSSCSVDPGVVSHVQVEPTLLCDGVPTTATWRILDLGCGSGLVGKAFGDFLGSAVAPPPPPLTDKGNVSTRGALETDKGGEKESRLAAGVTMYSTTLGDTAPLRLATTTSKRGWLAGADISGKMTAITARTACYDYVATCDVLDALQTFSLPTATTGSPCLELVVAADTFIYVGELGKVFAAAARALVSRGFFTFSIEDLERSTMRTTAITPHAGQCQESGENGKGERLEGEGQGQGQRRKVEDRQGACHVVVGDEVLGAVPGWGAQLLSSTRFAHSAAYIELLCLVHGFSTVDCRGALLRTEGSSPIHGLMYTLQKAE